MQQSMLYAHHSLTLQSRLNHSAMAVVSQANFNTANLMNALNISALQLDSVLDFACKLSPDHAPLCVSQLFFHDPDYNMIEVSHRCVMCKPVCFKRMNIYT